MQIPKLFILTIPTPPKKEWDAYVLYIYFEIHSCPLYQTIFESGDKGRDYLLNDLTLK